MRQFINYSKQQSQRAPGDIVYVPKQRWHLAGFAGDGMSARLAMNGYPDLAHSFEAPDSGEASR
jgi:hypothetical protein